MLLVGYGFAARAMPLFCYSDERVCRSSDNCLLRDTERSINQNESVAPGLTFPWHTFTWPQRPLAGLMGPPQRSWQRLPLTSNRQTAVKLSLPRWEENDTYHVHTAWTGLFFSSLNTERWVVVTCEQKRVVQERWMGLSCVCRGPDRLLQ